MYLCELSVLVVKNIGLKVKREVFMNKGKLSKKEKDTLEYGDIRSYKPKMYRMTLGVILSCGLIILLMGTYLLCINQVGTGTTIPGKFGTGGGQLVSVNGTSLIYLGSIFVIPSIWYIVKNRKKI